MVSSILRGGLGNYMFQVAAAVTLASNNNDTAKFDFNYTKQVHNNAKTYKPNLFRKLDDSLSVSRSNHYNEPSHSFNQIPYKENIILSGYFQSEKYLDRNLILDLFEIDETCKQYIHDKYGTQFGNTTSLHIRRGDYVDKQDRHPLMTVDYYQRALKLIPSTEQLYIFSDDINWCKSNLQVEFENTIYVENEPDYIDLWLMSMCNNNIIANSSFSWWAAWLNTNKNKKVISPKHTNWFGKNKKLNTKDLIPLSWEQI